MTAPRTYVRNGKVVPRPPSKQPLRGFAPWHPQSSGEPAKRLAIVQAIAAEYEDFLPLTLRQIYCRAVGRHGRPKTQAEYNCFEYVVAPARRARLIEFDDICDDGDVSEVPWALGDASAFHEMVSGLVERFRVDRQEGQPAFLEVYCEGAGMVEQLYRVTAEFGVRCAGRRAAVAERQVRHGEASDRTRAAWHADRDSASR